MSERMSYVGPKDRRTWQTNGCYANPGLARYGCEDTRAEMIAWFRAHWERQAALAEKMLALSDEELYTYTERNNVRRDIP